MRFRFYTLFGAFWIGLLAGCGGGDSDGGGDTTAQPTGGGDAAATTAMLKGTVTTGSAKTAVAGATVSAAGKNTVTDAQGRYTLFINNPDKSTVVLARKDGYLSMSKQAPMHADAVTTQDITLYREDVRTTFAAGQGKAVEVNGALVNIPANAIKDANGMPYTGTVTIAASYRNPTTVEGVDAFPQPYQGLDGGVKGTLQTVGVIEARLLDSNGQPLQLRSPATLTYPGVSAVDKGAATIPLWWYDDARAIWVREGQATRLADGSYQGTVSHFTQWNLDVFYAGSASGTVTACIKFQDGAAARYGIRMTLNGPGVAHPVFYGDLVEAGDLEIVNTPVNTPLTLVIQDAGNGKTIEVPVPPVPPGGTQKLQPCQTLVGTKDYVMQLTDSLLLPAPVPPNEAWSILAEDYSIYKAIGMPATSGSINSVWRGLGVLYQIAQHCGAPTQTLAAYKALLDSTFEQTKQFYASNFGIDIVQEFLQGRQDGDSYYAGLKLTPDREMVCSEIIASLKSVVAE